MGYSLPILPILFKESENVIFRSLMLWMVIWSCNGGQLLYGLEKGELWCCGLERGDQVLLSMCFWLEIVFLDDMEVSTLGCPVLA